VDVCVVEPRQHAAAAEVDDVRRGEGGLVDAHAAGETSAGDGKRTRHRHRRLERPDDAVLEDHGATVDGRCRVIMGSSRARRR
jgi:hypothetical protein